MIGLSLAAVEALQLEAAIATVEKNGHEEIRLSVSERGGRHMVTARVWADAGGGMVPTKSGFNFSVDRIPLFIAGLRAVCASLESRAP